MTKLEILCIVAIVLFGIAVFYFTPKSVEVGDSSGLWIRVTRPHGWGNAIKIKAVNIYYEQEMK